MLKVILYYTHYYNASKSFDYPIQTIVGLITLLKHRKKFNDTHSTNNTENYQKNQ